MKKVDLAGEELMYVTENSVWIIREDTYCRMPKVEEPRHYPSEAMKDGIWHPHEGVWEVEDGIYGGCLRVLPAGRPEGSFGLATSKIIAKYERQPQTEKKVEEDVS